MKSSNRFSVPTRISCKAFVLLLAAFIFVIPSVSHANTAPTVTVSAATAVGTSTATLNGAITVDGGASSTIEGFNFGTSTAYGSFASSTGTFGLGAFNQSLTGLIPGTTYHFEAFATNGAGTGTSSDMTFTASTTPGAPTSVVASTSTPAQATVTWSAPGSNGGEPILYYTVISSPAAYAATTSSLTATATGLSNGTSYTFTVSATSVIGVGATSTASNAVIPMTTATVAAAAASSIYNLGAILNGTISASGGDASSLVGFNYGLTTSYGGTVSAPGSFGLGAFSVAVASLTCNTLYHYEAFTTNGAGTSYSGDSTFTTATCPVAPGGGGGGASSAALASILAPSAATTAYLNSLKGFSPVVMSTSATNSATPSMTTTAGVSGTTFARNLRSGAAGADVKALQVYLNKHGYLVAQSGPGSLGNETTTFGSLTKKALIKFQTAQNLPSTGFFGPMTRALLNM